MAKQDKSKLKDWFRTGKYPTQEQFWDWMDSYIHRDDQLRIGANFPELDGVLQQKVDKEVFKHHFENQNNPHFVTKQQVGLGLADNTADVDKPISDATKSALDLKVDKTAMTLHLKDDTNPHKVTKQQIGLGNVDNTSDVDKPISKATQTALHLKANHTHVHDVDTLEGFDTDVTLAANSDEKVASQKAVKAYVDEQVKTFTKSGTTTAGTTTLPVMQFEQGVLLTIPQNGAWEWDGMDLYFTACDVRQKISKKRTLYDGRAKQTYVQSRVDKFEISPTDQDIIPAGIFSGHYNSLTKLKVLLGVRLSHMVPSSEFLVKTELFLNIKNGLFSPSRTGFMPYISLKIGEISGNTNVGVKEISIPIGSNGNELILCGINNIDGIKSEFSIPDVYLRDKANTRAFGAVEATFSFTVKATLTTTKPHTVLESHVNYDVTIRDFTLETIR